VDVLYFLEDRMRFIRCYYEQAALGFLETKRKIEAEEPPFDNPPWDESGEPGFLQEWMDAEDGLVMLGRSCVSMLSGSIQIYFKEWKKLLGITMTNEEQRAFFNNGILHGYRAVYEYFTKLSWSNSGANLGILEQVILARNNDQHPENIHTMHAYHKERDHEKYPDLFFLSERDKRSSGDNDASFALFGGHIVVTKETLFTAIDQLEVLARWLEPQLIRLRYESGHRTAEAASSQPARALPSTKVC
jgi:hypothetical protein